MRGLHFLIFSLFLMGQIDIETSLNLFPSCSKTSKDVCKNPYEFVCDRSPEQMEILAQLDQQEKSRLQETALSSDKKLYDLLKNDNLAENLNDPSSHQKALLEWISMLKKSQKKVWDSIEDTKNPERGFRYQADNLKKMLRQLLNDRIKFPNDDSKHELNKAVDGVVIQTADDLNIADTQALTEYYEECGVSGMTSGVFYSPYRRAIVVCMGTIFEMVKNGKFDLDSFFPTLAHEFGHLIDATGIMNFDRLDHTYVGYLECIKKNYLENFRSLADSVRYLETVAIPFFEKKVRELDQKTFVTDYDKLNAQRQLAQTKSRFDQLSSRLASDRRLFKSDPTALDSHQNELVADYWSVLLTGKFLQSSTPQRATDMLKQSLKIFCILPEYSERWGKDCDNGIHPPPRFRIEQYLRLPELRKTLGCKPLERTDQPWCDVKPDKITQP